MNNFKTPKHTPGPLAVEAEPFGNNDYLTEVVVPGRAGQPGTSVATCHHNWRDAGPGDRKISWAEAQANAHLYAAAPELLEAVDGVMDILGRAESNASGNPEWDYVGPRVAAVRAAITKARGEA